MIRCVVLTNATGVIGKLDSGDTIPDQLVLNVYSSA